MRISRLYTPSNLNIGQQIELHEESAHYIRNVLRLKINQRIALFNGQGDEYLCTLTNVTKKRVSVNIDEVIDRNVESPLYVALGLGISRGDRMDWSIQKAVELGANAITPLITERCVIKFKEDKKQQKLQHWKNIAQHASEQSGRTLLANLDEITTLQEWTQHQNGLKIFLDPLAEKSLTELEEPVNKKIVLLTGPEGGFSPLERDLAIENNFIPIRLGARILRTETASLAALSAIQTLWGDF